MYKNNDGRMKCGFGFLFHAGNEWSNGINIRENSEWDKLQIYVYLQIMQATFILVTTITKMATKWNSEVVSDKQKVVLISKIW
jgi:hypothetical protein